MNRTQMTLGVALLVQVGLILLLRGPLSGAATRGTTEALLPELASLTAQKIEITDGTGESVTLARAGDAWGVESLGGYPADAEKVSDVLAKLRTVDGRRPVVSSARNHEALKVAKNSFERRVRVWGDGDGAADAELFIGTSPSYQTSHVRRGNDDHVYEGQDVSAFDLPANPSSWTTRKLVDTTVDAVSAIEVANRHERFAIEKQEGQWRVTEPAAQASRPLDQEKVGTFVRMLAPLYVSEAAGRRTPQQGLDQALAAVTLRTGGQIITVEIGAEKPDASGLRYAAIAGSEFAAVIAKATAETLMNERLSDLLP